MNPIKKHFNSKILRTQGYITLQFTFIISVFLILFATISIAIAITKSKDIARTTCITEAVKTQSQALQYTRVLFSLNKPATFLRWTIRITSAAMVLATVTGQLQFLPALRTTLNLAKQSQKHLDKAQKILINLIKWQMKSNHYQTLYKMNKSSYENSKIWDTIVHINSFAKSDHTPSLAIRANSKSGTAPNYEWLPQAEKIMTVSYSWRMFFRSNNSFQNFIPWMNVLSTKCAVAPNLTEADKWTLTINVDKF